ncbi:unnamed protein product [Trichobilharzia regenti]|nr:unnamed protein product [Trichobilharzia regenti]
MDDAKKEFRKRLKGKTSQHVNNEQTSCCIDKLMISITKGCDESSGELWPSEKMNESYTITISNSKIEIKSPEVWGTLHALQTVLQLVHRNEFGTLVINESTIEDSLRFIHWGFVVNSAAHFINVDVMENFLVSLPCILSFSTNLTIPQDAMALVKMNVFHWHITDDSSFPYESSTYPELSKMGAYHPVKFVYGEMLVEQLLDYARLRGIRVLVEFDTPSHTRSWEKGHPGLRAKCYTKGSPNGETGPFDPTNKTTMEFLKSFFNETTLRFPERLIHLGGGDISFECWQSNPEILKFMRMQGYGDDFGKLESYYFEQLTAAIQCVQQKWGSITTVVWEDAFENGFLVGESLHLSEYQQFVVF